MREEQDRELEESEQRDRERAQAAEHERQAAEREQARIDAESAAEAVEKKALVDARRLEAQKFFEVPAPQGEICKLILRLPDGRRVERSFDADEELANVYAWASCCGELSALQGQDGFEVPIRFYLATTFPRVVLSDRAKSLRELQLLPNAILALCPEDT